MTVLETERKYRTKTINGEKSGGNNTAKPTLSPPVVSGPPPDRQLKPQLAVFK
jgi:hypothetical protein